MLHTSILRLLGGCCHCHHSLPLIFAHVGQDICRCHPHSHNRQHPMEEEGDSRLHTGILRLLSGRCRCTNILRTGRAMLDWKSVAIYVTVDSSTLLAPSLRVSHSFACTRWWDHVCEWVHCRSGCRLFIGKINGIASSSCFGARIMTIQQFITARCQQLCKWLWCFHILPQHQMWHIAVCFHAVQESWMWPGRAFRWGEAKKPGPHRLRSKTTPPASRHAEAQRTSSSASLALSLLPASPPAAPAEQQQEGQGLDDKLLQLSTLPAWEKKHVVKCALHISFPRQGNTAASVSCSWVGSKFAWRWQTRCQPAMVSVERKDLAVALLGFVAKNRAIIGDEGAAVLTARATLLHRHREALNHYAQHEWVSNRRPADHPAAIMGPALATGRQHHAQARGATCCCAEAMSNGAAVAHCSASHATCRLPADPRATGQR